MNDMTTDLVSIIIPSRNEPYLTRTIKDLLAKARGEVEVIAVLDGWWPKDIINDDRVEYLHYTDSRGMRNAINSGVAISNGNYILKTDAHCLFAEGYDLALKGDLEERWVVVPRRYALDPEHWQILDNPKYPIDYMYLSDDMHGEAWTEKNRDPKLESILIDDLMSFQGSAWFMKKAYYAELELMDEVSYGSFANEAQEIGLKAWLSGGRVVINKKTFYAHWHKTEGRGYSLSKQESEKGKAFTQQWKEKKGWHKQTLPLEWLIEKFAPVPTWGNNAK